MDFKLIRVQLYCVLPKLGKSENRQNLAWGPTGHTPVPSPKEDTYAEKGPQGRRGGRETSLLPELFTVGVPVDGRRRSAGHA